MEEIGGMIVHAEAPQAALDKGLAAHAENLANITRLIQYGAGVLKKLQAEAEQLGPRAEQAGAGAVREEVRESLAGAGAVVGDAARSALRPMLADAVALIGEARRAGMSLDEKVERFSNRMLAIMAASGIGAVMLVAFGVWVALAWQRSEIASLEQEKADLRGEVAAMASVAQIGARDANEPNHPTRQRAAIEMQIKDYFVPLSGELRMGSGVASRVDVAEIVRKKWADIGCSGTDEITVICYIQVQAPELAASSDTDGAGDLGFASYGLNEV
jgi:hypothetical protein